MDKAIENLNAVVECRETMIYFILAHCERYKNISDTAFNKAEATLMNRSYKSLKKQHDKLKGSIK